MRYFNTTGPCDPEEHYTLMREDLLAIGKRNADMGRYFTIFAPRQSGKTTYFELLARELKERYTLIPISMENLKTATSERFYKSLSDELHRELSFRSIGVNHPITHSTDLEGFFDKLRNHVKPVFLIIDEFEGIPDCVRSELMHTFRKMYHQKQHHALHSLALAGVSTISELILSSASPFNIAEQMNIPYFSPQEVRDLIHQYVSETGQTFEEEVIGEIHANTNGQPGLVCGLCRHLVEKVATDKSKAVAINDFRKTLRHFLFKLADLNILNIVQKARQKREFMLRLLFGEQPIPFFIHDPDIAYLTAHGVVDEADGYVGIPVPLYAKVLITAFRPLINGESEHYVTAKDRLEAYLSPDGLNIRAMLDKYRNYVAKRGFRAFDTDHLKEGAWHYSLDGFVNFFIERLGGQTFVEVPSGRGRTDIPIVFEDRKYVIETKIFTDNSYFEKGKRQLAAYLESEGLAEGYYVVFSNKHGAKDKQYFDENIEGKQIFTHIIRTNFKQASRH